MKKKKIKQKKLTKKTTLKGKRSEDPVKHNALSSALDSKSKGGRPSKYDKKFAEQLIKMFDIEPYEIKTVQMVSKGQILEIEKRVANDLPLIEEFARKIKVHKSTLYNWANEKDEKQELKHPEFFDALKRAGDSQARLLITNGLLGLYQTTFAIFAAKNIIGWRDAIDLTSDGRKLDDVRKVTYVIPAFNESVEPEKKNDSNQASSG